MGSTYLPRNSFYQRGRKRWFGLTFPSSQAPDNESRRSPCIRHIRTLSYYELFWLGQWRSLVILLTIIMHFLNFGDLIVGYDDSWAHRLRNETLGCFLLFNPGGEIASSYSTPSSAYLGKFWRTSMDNVVAWLALSCRQESLAASHPMVLFRFSGWRRERRLVASISTTQILDQQRITQWLIVSRTYLQSPSARRRLPHSLRLVLTIRR